MITQKLDQHVAAFLQGYEAEEQFFAGYKKHFPSRSAVIALLNDIKTLMFPGYFDNESAAGDKSEYLVSERLMHIQRVAQTQIKKALLYENNALSEEQASEQAEVMAEAFMDELPHVQALLLKDVQAAFDGDPAATSREEIVLCYPGFFAIFVHRIAHVLYQLKVPLIPRLMSEYAHGETGVDIAPGATIGEYFFIDHATGVVIGETTIIGAHCKLYQGVTLGALSTRKGQMLRGVKRHPTLEDYVTVYSNASVLGGETIIGEGSVIGGSAFVCQSTPKNARVSVKNQEITVHDPATASASDDGFEEV